LTIMSSLPKYTITFLPSCMSLDVLPGTALIEAAWLAGIRLASACGGNGKCLQCKVTIMGGKASPLMPQESDHLSQSELVSGCRLACCAYPLSDLEVYIPDKSLLRDDTFQTVALKADITVDPLIMAVEVQLKPPQPEDNRPDLARIKEELEKKLETQTLEADMYTAQELQSLFKSDDLSVTSYIRSNEIIGFALHGTSPFGVAIDLGTTKIAAYLMDLVTGRELAAVGALNPQTRYGDDIMTRLRYAIKNNDSSGKSTGKLTETVREKIRDMIAGLINKSGGSLEQIADLCVVGNTAMTYLFLDLPVSQLAFPPYSASVDHALDVKVRDLGITGCPGAYVHILPGIGGFVGSDHVAMILATDIDRSRAVTLGIDIGTNTEIVISVPDRPQMISASCPSGPAFEGAHVTDGMRAMSGAIDSVRLTESGVEYRTIGDAPATGLCGSGIIDAVAELHKWGVIDERGRMQKPGSRVASGEKGLEFEVVSEKDSKGRVVITQNDIDQVQLAKGAIRAGIEALLEVAGISHEAVGEVVLAGAFGSFINIENAININLLPWFPNALYRQVGNAAGQGAKMALVSKEQRKRAQQIAGRTRYLELTTHPGFKRLFASGMMFPEKP
jgi:uncharacterized 2Fe-2S/4Fe-4S cluster protein (DUF4445 family)